ncbi:diguanylate cyclase (GGDEF)-like protein [Sinobacterium caligoides]|uniref:diguanylate cyclase n=1 Tax=Sinobacterium caligoides TaxID=933926 RepID=A0A3N2DY98_9GAMM|nr:sensor domain-containing diguanylate cyclase [Sinobacterium caligoides]ROS04821.1 diguanylate cyclase (GGDEF)-like protein [Sinobacterium caligoides]
MTSYKNTLQVTAKSLSLTNAMLVDLMSIDEEYYRIFDSYHHIELELLACRTVREIAELLLTDVQVGFGLSSASLHLLDEDDAGLGLLVADGEVGDIPGVYLHRSEEDFTVVYGCALTPKVVAAADSLNNDADPCLKVLMMPLIRRGKLLGSLQYGLERTGWSSNRGTEQLLEHLCAVIAVSLENCISQQYLTHLSVVDALTNVRNRRGFEIDLLQQVMRAERCKASLSCLFIDIDHFKRVNDLHGHLVGDCALQQVVAVISSQLTGSSRLARYGGEEFAVLLAGYANEQALELAESVRISVQDHEIRLSGTRPFKVTVSVGVATWEGGQGYSDIGAHRTGQWLVHCADNALYEAKHGGRNKVCNAVKLEHPLAVEP